jgi:hypothetical protein
MRIERAAERRRIMGGSWAPRASRAFDRVDERSLVEVEL